MSAFMKSINAFVDKSKADMVTVVKVGCAQIINEFIDMSPVGQPSIWQSKPPKGYIGGRFRANWQVTFNTPSVMEIRTAKDDPTGQVALEEGTEKAMTFNLGVDAVYFTNNVPYAYRLEMGHSTQAPNGVVRIAALNATKYFNEGNK